MISLHHHAKNIVNHIGKHHQKYLLLSGIAGGFLVGAKLVLFFATSFMVYNDQSFADDTILTGDIVIESTGTNLTGTELTGTELTGTVSTGNVETTGENLTGVVSTGSIESTGENLTGTISTGSVESTGENLTGVVFTGTELTGVVNTGVVSTGAELTGVVNTGTISTGTVNTGTVNTGTNEQTGSFQQISSVQTGINISNYVTGIVLSSSGATSGYLPIGAVVKFSFESTGSLTGISVLINSGKAIFQNKSGTHYDYAIMLTGGMLSGVVPYQVSFSDIYGNTGSLTGISTFIFDNVYPLITGLVITGNYTGLTISYKTLETVRSTIFSTVHGVSTGQLLYSTVYQTGHSFILNSFSTGNIYDLGISLLDQAGNVTKYAFYLEFSGSIYNTGTFYTGALYAGILSSGTMYSGCIYSGIFYTGALYTGVVYSGVSYSGCLYTGSLYSWPVYSNLIAIIRGTDVQYFYTGTINTGIVNTGINNTGTVNTGINLKSILSGVKQAINNFNSCKEDIDYKEIKLQIKGNEFKLAMPNFKKSDIKTIINTFSFYIVQKLNDSRSLSQDELTDITEKFDSFLVILKLVKDDNNSCKQNLSNYHIGQFEDTLKMYGFTDF